MRIRSTNFGALGTAILAFVLLVTVHQTVDAQTPSMFERRDHQKFNLITDVKAQRPGDLLFVRIEERSDVNNIDQRRLQKQNDSSSSGDGSYSASGGLGNASGGLGFTQDSSADRQFRGNAEYLSQRGFNDRFAVKIVDTRPNGVMIISGSRDVRLEGDTRRLIVTGMIRNVDVTRDNTIPSAKIADLSIRYETTGKGDTEQSFINQGWLARKFNRLWPY